MISAFRAIRIVDSVLVVVAQDIFDIFNRYLDKVFDTKESQLRGSCDFRG